MIEDIRANEIEVEDVCESCGNHPDCCEEACPRKRSEDAQWSQNFGDAG